MDLKIVLTKLTHFAIFSWFCLDPQIIENKAFGVVPRNFLQSKIIFGWDDKVTS